jgi:putative membrane protein
MHDSNFWGMHFFWWIFWIIVLVWIFFLPYRFPYQRKNPGKSALDILQERYAKGEISKEEYEERRRTLES